MRGAGRAAFAAILLLIAGTLNIIYGIGALDSANIYANDTRYIFTNLNTMGWVLIVLGVIQLTGGFSLLSGNTYGRYRLPSAPASVRSGRCCRSAATTRGGRSGIFALCIYIISGIAQLGDDEGVPVRCYVPHHPRGVMRATPRDAVRCWYENSRAVPRLRDARARAQCVWRIRSGEGPEQGLRRQSRPRQAGRRAEGPDRGDSHDRMR